MSALQDAVSTAAASTITGSVPADDGMPAISKEFRSLLAELAERRSATQASPSKAHSLYGRIDGTVQEISGRLQGFFSSDENLYSRLNQAARFFSSSTSARNEFVSTMNTLSKNNPAAAAGLLKDLFALQSSLSQALQRSTGRASRAVFAQIHYLKLVVQGELSSSLGSFAAGNSAQGASTGSSQQGFSNLFGNSSGSSFRFAQMYLQISLQQIFSSATTAQNSSGNSANFDFSLMVKGSYVQADMMLQALDPLVLDLNGDGVDLSPVEDGVIFDLAGDGEAVRCGFVTGDDALLFLDQNGDGVCTNGLELFGDQEGDANGFAELGKYDRNGDGSIDADDDVYDELKVWNDWNGDGACEEGEVRSLAEAGVAEIGLRYRNACGVRSGGNDIAQTGFFRTLAGELRSAVDAKFNYCAL